jgi:hypothetical protein
MLIWVTGVAIALNVAIVALAVRRTAGTPVDSAPEPSREAVPTHR